MATNNSIKFCRVDGIAYENLVAGAIYFDKESGTIHIATSDITTDKFGGDVSDAIWNEASSTLNIIKNDGTVISLNFSDMASASAVTSALNNKVDKVNGKQLSTEDFTTALKTKLEGLSNYDDTTLSNALSTLRSDFDKLVSGDTTTAIKTFNEVIAFLDGIADTEDLAGIIASIEQQIASKADDSLVLHKAGAETITGAKTFNSGVNFLGSGDSNAVTLSTNTRINVNGTNKTVLGFGSSSFYINHGDYTLLLRGKATRPTYNGADMALASDVAAKQDNLVSGTNIKTINGTSILGNGDITIESGTTLTEVDIADMGFTKNQGTITEVKMNGVSKGASGVVDLGTVITEHQDISGKQDTITDLATIRSGAEKGASAVQPSSLATVATSGSYNDLSNKPTIPSAVTESTVSGWGFTKNTGTYSKPSGGIPKTDLASAVQTSLSKADTALQSYTEQYKGTITGVSANGTSVATSGVANIPAASTSAYGVTKLSSATNSTSTTLAATASSVKAAYDLANGKQEKLVSGTNIKTINGTSILGSGDITISGGSSDANIQAVDTGDVIDDVNVDYATKTYVDGLIGDINSVLESIINGVGILLITFTIDGTEYQAEDGMTWEQWVNSEYNTKGFTVYGGQIRLNFSYIISAISSDVIISNYAYATIIGEGGSGGQ